VPSQAVLVTGAAGGAQGQTGRRVAEMLLAKGVPVRAFVHRIDARSDHLRGLGAEVVQGDFLDAETVLPAVEGVAGIYFAYPVQDGLLDASVITAVAARKAGIRRLIDLEMLRSSLDAPTPRMRQNYLSEQVFEWAGVGVAHIRAAVFYENVNALVGAALAAGDVVRLPWGSENTVIPLVSAKDVARVAVALLTGSTPAPGAAYPVVAEVLTVGGMIDIFARVLRKPIRYESLPDEAWRSQVRAQRYNEHAIEHLSSLWKFLRGAPRTYEVTNTVKELVGTAPEPFEAFVQDKQAASAADVRSA
jgi:uncharacterized protein YbjT (DUF2867 family)